MNVTKYTSISKPGVRMCCVSAGVYTCVLFTCPVTMCV